MASFTVPCPKTASIACFGSSVPNSKQNQQKQRISFLCALDSNPSLPDSAFCGFQGPNRKQSDIWKVHAQLNEVAAEKSSNSAPALDSKLGATSSEGKSSNKISGQNTIPDAASVSAFMTQVSDLVKLVDSRDIMELHLKQLDCELIIRKKEALQQPPPAAPIAAMPPPMPYATLPSPPPAQAVAPPATPAPSAPALPAPAKPSTSSHPPLKCPMAGTFYRCSGPGEPPFVKVGDKVQKGQVICIIEAMKLMNEIEADQSGTITEILVEDGKSVSVDLPLFVIVP